MQNARIAVLQQLFPNSRMIGRKPFITERNIYAEQMILTRLCKPTKKFWKSMTRILKYTGEWSCAVTALNMLKIPSLMNAFPLVTEFSWNPFCKTVIILQQSNMPMGMEPLTKPKQKKLPKSKKAFWRSLLRNSPSISLFAIRNLLMAEPGRRIQRLPRISTIS